MRTTLILMGVFVAAVVDALGASARVDRAVLADGRCW
jgi:hypothetical protein